jgi:hypothetical protein
MDRTVGQWIFEEGNEVFGSEGDKLGKIVAVHPTYIVVEKGFFFPMDYYIPMEAIASFDGERVVLSVTKNEALENDWTNVPKENVTTNVTAANYDASGTAKYAEAVDRLNTGEADSNAAAAFGTTGHMGESATTPGLAGDLTVEQDQDTRIGQL